MKNDYRSTRYERRTKNRKANVVLNSLIGLVVLLIIFVSANIFLGDKNEKVSKEEESKVVEQESEEKEEEEETTAPVVEEEEKVTETTEEAEESTTGDNSNKEESEVEDDVAAEENAEVIVTDGGSAPEVVRTIVNPAWKPVGTVQQGVHSNNYDRNGHDWNEMVEAITYATGISADNMTIHFLGNNGHNKSVGTVYTKNKAEIYRVYIDWVDGEGWKPAMVEELSAVPEKKKKEKAQESESDA